MSFWEAQARSRRKSRLCIFLFFLITLTAGFLLELALRKSMRRVYDEQIPFIFIAFTSITLICATYYFIRLRCIGGAAIAQTLGAKAINPATEDSKEKQLINIVDEIKIAANLPTRPQIYILEAQEINAFASGIKMERAAITVTRGALNQLNRDELQGVIGHEVGHIVNRDMQLNSQLGALLYGLTFVTTLGFHILRISSHGRRKTKGQGAVIICALFTIAIGGIAWCLSKVVQSCLSREREMLADASAVQFTRSKSGLINALRKIEHDSCRDMPSTGSAFSHLYFQKNRGVFDAMLASHPPIYKRIMAIEEMASKNPL